MNLDARIMALDEAIRHHADWEELGRQIRQVAVESVDLSIHPSHLRGRISPAEHRAFTDTEDRS